MIKVGFQEVIEIIYSADVHLKLPDETWQNVNTKPTKNVRSCLEINWWL